MTIDNQPELQTPPVVRRAASSSVFHRILARALARPLLIVGTVALSVVSALAKDRSQPPMPKGDPAQWITSADYPPEALEKNEQGATTFEVNVDALGTVTACRIVNSSNSSALDDKTCSIMLSKAQFEPARDANGRRVASKFERTVRWVIPTMDPTDLTEGRRQVFEVISEVTLDTDGRVVSCRVVSKTQIDGDPCKQFPAGRFLRWRGQAKGEPVSVVLTITNQIYMDPK